MNQLTFPAGSNVKSASFDPTTRVAEVEFSSGKKYRYQNFTPELMAEWNGAESASKWFNATVKANPKTFPLVPEGVASAAGVDRTEETTVMETGARLAVDFEATADDARMEAEALYVAYIANSGGKAWDGRPCPAWKDLGNPVRSHWCAVVLEVRRRRSSPETTVEGIERASMGSMESQLSRARYKIDELERRVAFADSAAVDRVVTERTLELDLEIDKLRARIAELEAKALGSRARQ